MPYQLGPLRASIALSPSSTLPRPKFDPAVDQSDGERCQRSLADVGKAGGHRGVVVLLDRTRRQYQARDRIAVIDLDQPFGRIERQLDIAVGHMKDDGALQQRRVLGVVGERVAVEGGRGADVLGHVGAARGQVAAGKRRWKIGHRRRGCRGVPRDEADQSGEADAEAVRQDHDPRMLCKSGGARSAWRQDDGFMPPPQASHRRV